MAEVLLQQTTIVKLITGEQFDTNLTGKYDKYFEEWTARVIFLTGIQTDIVVGVSYVLLCVCMTNRLIS